MDDSKVHKYLPCQYSLKQKSSLLSLPQHTFFFILCVAVVLTTDGEVNGEVNDMVIPRV